MQRHEVKTDKMAAPIQLPRLHDRDGFLDDGARMSKRTKYNSDHKFNKQSTSFAALEEEEDVLRHGEKIFLFRDHSLLHTVSKYKIEIIRRTY